MSACIKRRQFLALVGGAAVTLPFAARAQDSERMRSVAILLGGLQDNSGQRTQLDTFRRTLADLHWIEGKNIRFDVRFAAGDIQRMRAAAQELAALRPDAFLSATTPVTIAIQKLTQAIPIVFVNVSDPIGDGVVASLARPGGNITGFINVEASMAGKWLELLREIAPGLRRAAVLLNPDIGPARGTFFNAPIQAAASSLNLSADLAPVRTGSEIDTLIESLGREQGSGLVIVPGGAFARIHQQRIQDLSVRHRVPAIYPERGFAEAGGLLSYGPDYLDLYRRAAGYVDRVLRGTRPADLPVQVPTKFELVVNLWTAKAMGLAVPPTLLTRADEVIE